MSSTLNTLDGPKSGAAGGEVFVKPEDDWTEDVSVRQEQAARYTAYERSLSFWQTFKVYWRCILWVMYGQAVVFGYGIDGVIAAYLLGIPRFRQDYGERFDTGTGVSYIISANWIALYGGISQLCAIIGALFTGYLADKIGRRYTNALSCIISIAGIGAQYASTVNGSLAILCVGKAINGIPIGMWLVIGPLYASEVAPLALRGWLIAVTNITQFCGVLLFTGIMYSLGPRDSKIAYQVPFACQWIIPCLVLLTVMFWPESPVWLVRTGQREQAIKSIARLHGSKSSINKDGILAQIEETFAEENLASTSIDSKSYLECFKKEHRHRTLISMFVYGCQYLSGLVFVLGYQSYFYQLIGYSAKKSFLLSMLNNVFQFVANILSWFLIAAVGRRPLIVWGQLCGAVCLFIVAGCTVIGTTAGYLAVVAFMFVWVSLLSITLEIRYLTSYSAGIYISAHSWNCCVDHCRRDSCTETSSQNTGPGELYSLLCSMARWLHVSLHVQPRCRKPRWKGWLHLWRNHFHRLPRCLALVAGN